VRVEADLAADAKAPLVGEHELRDDGRGLALARERRVEHAGRDGRQAPSEPLREDDLLHGLRTTPDGRLQPGDGR
jgi:hypothetical protein